MNFRENISVGSKVVPFRQTDGRTDGGKCVEAVVIVLKMLCLSS